MKSSYLDKNDNKCRKNNKIGKTPFCWDQSNDWFKQYVLMDTKTIEELPENKYLYTLTILLHRVFTNHKRQKYLHNEEIQQIPP